MMEKNHKHEMGVEMAHHKEIQRNLAKLNEENKELKLKLEEKERALDISNIYSNRQPKESNGQQPAWKTSSNSLNNTPYETPREKRKESEKKKKEIKSVKKKFNLY